MRTISAAAKIIFRSLFNFRKEGELRSLNSITEFLLTEANEAAKARLALSMLVPGLLQSQKMSDVVDID